MAAHQAPPSLGFSRQEHWSGLPFPSPMHDSKKWKWSHSAVSDSLATPWTAAHQAPSSMGFSRQEYWSGMPLPYCQTPLQSGENPKSVPTRSILMISCQIVAIIWQLSTFYFCQSEGWNVSHLIFICMSLTVTVSWNSFSYGFCPSFLFCDLCL